MVGEKQKNSTGQLRLQARLNIRSNVHSLKSICSDCSGGSPGHEGDSAIDSEENCENISSSNHCHCSLFIPSEELIDFMCGGKPSRRFRKRYEEQAEHERLRIIQSKAALEEDREVAKKDLVKEVQKLKNKEHTKSKKVMGKQVFGLRKA